MNVAKVSIRDIDIPINYGTVRWLYFGGVISIEVELDVHPTIVNFINTAGFLNERVTILSETETEMTGKFTIHTGTAGILLTSDINKIEGAEKFTPTPITPDFFLSHSEENVSLSSELKAKQKPILIMFLNSLLEAGISDRGNREFIHSLVDKLNKGQRLDAFDYYLMDEIRFLLEENINHSKRLIPGSLLNLELQK